MNGVGSDQQARREVESNVSLTLFASRVEEMKGLLQRGAQRIGTALPPLHALVHGAERLVRAHAGVASRLSALRSERESLPDRRAHVRMMLEREMETQIGGDRDTGCGDSRQVQVQGLGAEAEAEEAAAQLRYKGMSTSRYARRYKVLWLGVVAGRGGIHHQQHGRTNFH